MDPTEEWSNSISNQESGNACKWKLGLCREDEKHLRSRRRGYREIRSVVVVNDDPASAVNNDDAATTTAFASVDSVPATDSELATPKLDCHRHSNDTADTIDNVWQLCVAVQR